MADNEDTNDKTAAPAAMAIPSAPGSKQPGATKPKPEAPRTFAGDAKPAEAKPIETLVAKAAKAVIAAPPKSAAPVPPVVEAAKPTSGSASLARPEAKAKPRFQVPTKTPAKPEIKTAPLAKAKPKAVEPVVPAKIVTTKPVIKVAEDVKAPQVAVTAPEVATPNAAPETARETKPVFAGLFSNFMLEEKNMDMSTNFAGFQTAMTEAQAKAKAAFEKSTGVLGEVTEFAKGNVEAVVASGKILAEGVQGIGSELVAEGRTAFETMTGDIKELAAAKSPTDFFKIQSDMVRKNFDSAVAYSSKNSEAMLKLFSDSFAPISGRMSLAMDKARSVSV